MESHLKSRLRYRESSPILLTEQDPLAHKLSLLPFELKLAKETCFLENGGEIGRFHDSSVDQSGVMYDLQSDLDSRRPGRVIRALTSEVIIFRLFLFLCVSLKANSIAALPSRLL
jgi:hypothetical protein